MLIDMKVFLCILNVYRLDLQMKINNTVSLLDFLTIFVTESAHTHYNQNRRMHTHYSIQKIERKLT